VPVHARGARLIQENVRERMRQMAGERDQTVVRLRIDRDRNRTERSDKAVQHPVALRIRRRVRREEPRRAAKQPAARMLRAVRLRATDRMAPNESGVAHRARHRRLRRADVRHRRPVARPLEHGRHLRWQRRHRRGDDHELGVRHRSAE